MTSTETFDTLIACTVAYYQAHPGALECYGREPFFDGCDIGVWASATPPWNTPGVLQQLEKEGQRVLDADAATQERYCVAFRAALAQVAHGEHA